MQSLSVTTLPRRAVLMATSPLFFRWFMTGHVPALRAAGWEVHLCSGHGPELAPFAAETAAPAHPVGLEREISLGRDPAALLELVRLFRRLRPSLVHASTPKAGLFGMLAAWLLRVPVRVYHCHGLRYQTAHGPLRVVLRTAERMACGLATEVLAVSRSLADQLVAEGLAPEGKITVLHHGSVSGVDAAQRFVPATPEARADAKVRLGLPPEAPVLGYVGRVVRDKGIPELWQAWLQLREAWPTLRLVLVGPVEDGDPVPFEVLLGLQGDPRVLLVGQTEETPPLFAAMDVVTLPSFREGFGLVTVEAGAMGLPVVASRVTGIVDAVVDGQTGTLVPAGDAAALAQGVSRYLSHPGLATQHGQAGRARAIREYVPADLEQALVGCYSRWIADAAS